MRTTLFRILLAAVATFGLACAHAQPYPSRPVRIIVPYPPGGGTDITARILAQRLGEELAQPVVVDNRAGAGGTLGTARAAKSPPDGYTLLLGQTGPNAISPSLYENPGYDAENDFAPITLVTKMPLILTVRADSEFRTVAELIDAGRKSDRLNYASAGSGSTSHLSTELMNTMAGTKFVHIPYKGTAPALTALLAGEVSMYFMSSVDALPQIRQGKLRALAVASGERSALVPTVPTLAESGLTGVSVDLWYGLLAPARTPRPVVDRLNAAVLKILAEPAVRARLLELNSEPATSSPEEFSALIRADIAKYAKVVKAAGVKGE
jgi:tripartite-type tricarboxylate transporter receptor subunit TctC